MNKGVIKEIEYERGKTQIKISLDLKYKDEESEKKTEYNIYICEDKNEKSATLIEVDNYFEITPNICPVNLLNKKCRFDICKNDETATYEIKSIIVKADEE